MNETNYEIIAEESSGIDAEALSELLELESRRYSRRLSEEDEARQR